MSKKGEVLITVIVTVSLAILDLILEKSKKEPRDDKSS